MRIHHIICDVQKHLLHTDIKLNENVIDNYLIHVTIQQNIKNVSKNSSNQVRLQQRLIFATKHVLNKCENSSQNHDVQKHLLHTHIKLNEKVIDNYFIHVTIQQNIKNV